jgi:hypothetical protein
MHIYVQLRYYVLKIFLYTVFTLSTSKCFKCVVKPNIIIIVNSW